MSRKSAPRAKQPPLKNTTQESTFTDLFKSGAWLIGSFILALILVIGHFDIGGRLPAFIADGGTYAVGLLSWTVLPVIIVYLAIIKYHKRQKNLPLNRWLPAVVLLVALSGMLHVFIDSETALAAVKDGEYGGGYIGYGLAYALQYQQILNDWLAFLILLAVTIVTAFSMFNITFAAIGKLLKTLFGKVFKSKPTETETEEQPAEPLPKPSPKAPVTKSAPVEISEADIAIIPDTETVLTAPADPSWKFPPLNLLIQKQDKADAGDIQANAETIRETLANFNIDVEMEGANVGPRVTQYTLRPPSGIKLSRILSLESNIALDLAASSIRIEAPIPGQRAVGIEVPNKKPAIVRLSSIFASSEWQNTTPNSLAFCIGQSISGQAEIAYLEKMPHILLAGQTGSGKSVGINILLTSLLYRNSPSDLKLILVDPKQVEMGPYNHIPHLLTPVITTPEKCISALKWAVAEMERRLKEFAKFSKRNIAEYNALKDQISMPFIVIVVDELADLMIVAARDVETLIVRIAQKARAAGIHLVLATQRPSVDVITGLIKANVPARLAFTTASQVDSRTILDQVGAEKLLGSGDILYINASIAKPRRLQGAFITDDETEKICQFLRDQRPAQYDSEIISQEVSLPSSPTSSTSSLGDNEDDELTKKAIEVVVDAGKASTSLLQRRLRIGYARAARLIETLEEQGIIGPADGSRPRPVLRQAVDELETDSQSMDFDDEESTGS